MLFYAIIIGAAYLFGSIPFGFLLVLLIRKEDIRDQGSGNIGATNVLRSGSKGLGVLTFLLDAGKGYAAVAVAALLARHSGVTVLEDSLMLAALCTTLGHVFPVWLRFHGGKGVATAFGAFLAISPPAALIALGIFTGLVLLTRYVSLASIVAAIALPFLTLSLSPFVPTDFFRAAAFACAVLVVSKHRKNIQRLVSGTEYRFGGSRSTPA